MTRRHRPYAHLTVALVVTSALLLFGSSAGATDGPLLCHGGGLFCDTPRDSAIEIEEPLDIDEDDEILPHARPLFDTSADASADEADNDDDRDDQTDDDRDDAASADTTRCGHGERCPQPSAQPLRVYFGELRPIDGADPPERNHLRRAVSLLQATVNECIDPTADHLDLSEGLTVPLRFHTQRDDDGNSHTEVTIEGAGGDANALPIADATARCIDRTVESRNIRLPPLDRDADSRTFGVDMIVAQ